MTEGGERIPEVGATSAPPEFSLTLGDGWDILPTETDALLAWVRERVSGSVGDLTGLERTFIEASTADLRRACSEGAHLIALFCEPIEQDAPAPDQGVAGASSATAPALLIATVTLTFLHRSLIEGLQRFTPGFTRLALHRDPRGRPLALPRTLELDGGAVVETIELREDEPPFGHDALHVTHHKPLVEGEWLGIVTFQSPNVELESDWLQVSRAVAGSLSVEARS